MSKDITQLFNKFVGREVPVRELSNSETGTVVYVEALNAPDPVIKEMEQLAKDNALSLRVWFPAGSRGTMDARRDRMNAHVEKAADGKYRVTDKFHIG